MKHLLSKKDLIIVENWLNPVLSGDVCGVTVDPSVISSPFNADCELSVEPPEWLQSGAIRMNGDVLSLGATYINGQPITSWGARFGSSVLFNRANLVNQYRVLNDYLDKEFPNGIGRRNTNNNLEEIIVKDLVILRLVANSSGIGMTMHVRFRVNEDLEVWGKFSIDDSTRTPKFVTADLKDFEQNNKIRIVGKVWNAIKSWLKPINGVYKCLAKEINVFDEVGQNVTITEGEVIDVYYSDDTEIHVTLNDKKLIVKKPTYYWFNYFFAIIKT